MSQFERTEVVGRTGEVDLHGVATPLPPDSPFISRREVWWVPQARWIFFSVILGAVPIVASILWKLFNDASDPFTPALDKGQLLIAAVGLSGSSIGRILKRSMTNWGIVLGGVGTIQALIGALVFAFAQANTGPVSNPGRLIGFSLLWWAIAVVNGCFCLEAAR